MSNHGIQFFRGSEPAWLHEDTPEGYASEWSGLPAITTEQPSSGESGSLSCAYSTLIYRARGGCHGSFRTGGVNHRFEVRERTFTLCAAGYEVDSSNWRGEVPQQATYIEFNPSRYEAFYHRRIPDFQSAVCFEDEHVEKLVLLIKSEIRAGSHGGALYAEGLSLALLGRIAAEHTRDERKSRSRVLSACDIRRIEDYIEAMIGENISLSELANLVKASPAHFSKMFKEALGVSPYRYVQELRIRRAKKLINTDIPLIQIATLVGYSTQAHFTQVFRQLTGTTPARWRARA